MTAAAPEADELAVAVVQFRLPRFVLKRNPANRCKSNCWRDLNFRRLLSVSPTSHARNHAGKTLKHFLPADLSSPERLLAPGRGDVKAGMLSYLPSCTGGGLSPAECEYNEQAATVRTPARDKNIDAPESIRRRASFEKQVGVTGRYLKFEPG